MPDPQTISVELSREGAEELVAARYCGPDFVKSDDALARYKAWQKATRILDAALQENPS